MTTFLANSPLVESIGWLLVHSLWQFAAIALVAAALLGLLRRASAEMRYWSGLLALGAMVAAPLITWSHLPLRISPRQGDGPIAGEIASLPTDPATVREIPARPALAIDHEPAAVPLREEQRASEATRCVASASRPAWWPNVERKVTPWLPAIVLAWCGGVLLFALRPLASWLAIGQLRSRGISSVPPATLEMQARVAQRLNLRRAVKVVQSTLVRAPLMVGWLRPLILLPVSVVCELPAGQLEAILAHELAHIRRHDFPLNVLQTLIETVFFYHPAVWWLSQRIRAERENCCDDLAIAALDNRGEYGRALLAIEELRGGESTLALGAGGGALVTRIRRIAMVDAAPPSSLSGSAAALVFVAIALTAGGIWGTNSAAVPTTEAAQGIGISLPLANAWPQWGGSSVRNNVSRATNLPMEWDVAKQQNIRWSVPLGTFSFNSPVVSQGKVLIGTNNRAERNPKFPKSVDLSCLQCFDEQTGEFLWQYASSKLPAGSIQDRREIFLCATPAIDGDRVWLVTNRAEVLCLDLLGFRDGENDGPITDETETDKNAADVIWRLNMSDLGVNQTYQSSSVTLSGDLVLLNTGNGYDGRISRRLMLAPTAPSFLAVNRHTGRVVWSDASPGKNILGGRGPSSSPAVAQLGGVFQAIFAGADGWLYSFDVRAMEQGRTLLLWKFDCNPKTSRYEFGNRGTRNSIVATPVIYEGRVYLPVGLEPEKGEGPGRLWCIDPSKRGDISPELVFNKANPDQPIAHKGLQACDEAEGDFTRPNSNSGLVWHYESLDLNADGKIAFEETFHRSCGSVAVHEGLLVVADSSGLLHCLDALTGRPLWTHDLLAAALSTPLIADGKIYVGDEDGDIAIFRLARTKELIAEPNLENSIYGTPAAANETLFVGTKTRLYAIQQRTKE